MSTNALAILGDGYQITITPEAEAQKAAVLDLSRAVQAVTDQDSCDIAQARIKALAAIRIAVDKSRELVKKPVLDLGRTIDATAKTFSAEVVAEEARLSALVNEYAREQQRKAREAAEAAERERQRIEREEHEARMAALRAEQEAERKKHEAEMERLRAEQQQDAAAQAEARRREEEAAKAQREAAERAEAARLEAEQAAAEARRQEEAARSALAAPVMPNGTKEEIDFEVVDIVAFAAKFPQLVTFIPKRADILAALKKSYARNGTLPEVPGLRVFQNLRVKTR